MKIIINHKEDFVEFGDLQPGDVFKSADMDGIWLKIDPLGQSDYNCLFLNNMRLDYIANSCEVIPIKSTLILGEEKRRS